MNLICANQTSATRPVTEATKPRAIVAFVPALVLYIFIVGFIQFFVPPLPTSYSYLAAVIDKIALLQRSASPKVIIVGGSNAAFGIDSQLIEHRLNKPVINMGLNAGLGLRYMMRQVVPNIRSGDIVLIVPEYEQYWICFDGGAELMEVLYLHPNGLSALAIQHAPVLVRSIPRLLKKKVDVWRQYGIVNLQKDTIYARDTFDASGSHISHLDKSAPHPAGFADFEILTEKVDASVLCELASFKKLCAERGAKMALSFGPLPNPTFANPSNARRLKKLEASLRETLGDSVLGSPAQFVYPVDEFFDTPHHLTRIARSKNTETLITELKQLGTSGTAGNAAQ